MDARLAVREPIIVCGENISDALDALLRVLTNSDGLNRQTVAEGYTYKDFLTILFDAAFLAQMVDYAFWLGLSAAIPLSVVANLVTPYVRQKLDARSTRVSAKQRARMLKEYARIKQFYDDRTGFVEYLVLTVIRTTFVGALAGIFSALFLFLPGILRYVGGLPRVAVEVSGLFLVNIFTVGGAAAISSFCSEALQTFRRVRDFPKYEAGIRARLGDEALDVLPSSNS